MALKNIIQRHVAILDSLQNPLESGLVYLYEPGTEDFVVGFKDSGLVSEHSNPIKLNGAGRTSVWISRDVDIIIRDKEGNLVVEELNANPDSLGTNQSGGLVANGSFENDTDADNIPDDWTLSSYVGSNNLIDNSESTDGLQAFRFTATAATGGGDLVTESFFPVNDINNLNVNFDVRSTVSGVRNIVNILWFDVAQAAISTSAIYDSTTNPTTYTEQQTTTAPPSGARFAKLQLIGIDPSVVVAGTNSTYFDRITVFYPAVVSGVFDNLTLQNNEIISTNTNGNVELNPNGAGLVQLKNNNEIKAQTNTSGLDVLGSLDNAIGGLQDAQLNLASQSNLNLGVLGFLGDEHLTLRSNNHGGHVRVEGEDATGTLQEIAFFNPDLTAAGSPGGSMPRLRLTATNRLSTLASVSNALMLGPLTGENLAGDSTGIQARNNGGASTLDLNALGGGLALGSPTAPNIDIDETNDITLNRAGGLPFAVSDATGLSVQSASDDARLTLKQSNGTDVAFYRSNATDELQIQNLINSGPIWMLGLDSLGVSSAIFSGDPDGAANLFFDNALRFSTKSNGIVSRGSLNAALGGSQDAQLQFATSAEVDLGFVGFSDENLRVRNNNHGGNILLQSENAAGTLRSLLSGDPDGATELFREGVSVARTVTAANGGLEVNNALTASGYERVLTESDQVASGYSVYVLTDLAIDSTDTVEFTTFKIDDLPVGQYAFEFYFTWNQLSAAGQGIRFAFGDNVGGFNILCSYRPYFVLPVIGADNTVVPVDTYGSRATTMQEVVYNLGSTSVESLVTGQGLVRVANSGFDFGFWWAQETSSAQEIRIKEGWIKLTPLPNGN